MENIGIITDTNSGLLAPEAEQYGIELMPMPFFVDGVEYVENINMSQTVFYQRMSQGAAVATSQPSPETVTICWSHALERYDRLIYIPMSSALSSSCQSARLFAEDFDGRVLVVDNHRISISQKQSAIDAAHWRDAGLDADAIVQNLMDTAMDASIYLTVEDLKYLKHGGRITPSVAAIGTVLNIKPVLQIQGGRLDTFKKVRGLRAAQGAMLEAVEADLAARFSSMDVYLRTAYAGDREMGRLWNEHVQARFPQFHVTGDALPISIGCHVGPGTVALGLNRKVL